MPLDRGPRDLGNQRARVAYRAVSFSRVGRLILGRVLQRLDRALHQQSSLYSQSGRSPPRPSYRRAGQRHESLSIRSSSPEQLVGQIAAGSHGVRTIVRETQSTDRTTLRIVSLTTGPFFGPSRPAATRENPSSYLAL
jgi:hypothetical protein